jgi:uncharacterized protein (TIGR02001 family)
MLIPGPASAQGWGGSLGVSSDQVFRGISRSDGRASVQGDAHYYADAGWRAGLWVASLDPSPTPLELDAYLGYTRTLGADWSARADLTHYAFPHSTNRYDYDELAATLAWRGLLAATLAWSPDTAIDLERGSGGSRHSTFAYELAASLPLASHWQAGAGAGWNDLRAQYGSGYAYWNLDLAYLIGAAQVQLSWVGSSDAARDLYGAEVAHPHWLGTLLWHF